MSLLVCFSFAANTNAEATAITIKSEPIKPVRLISGSVTMYSSVESCSTPKCLMASGKSAYIGAAACPNQYKLGTKVMIEGKTYTCEDREALWVQKKYNNAGFDLFAGYNKEAYNKAIKFGRRKLEVTILEKL